MLNVNGRGFHAHDLVFCPAVGTIEGLWFGHARSMPLAARGNGTEPDPRQNKPPQLDVIQLWRDVMVGVNRWRGRSTARLFQT